MGSNKSSFSRVNSDSPSTTETIKQTREAVHSLWPTAPSLRPDSVKLAEACMEGDENAIAIRDAWQFQTSRATRVTVVAADSPMGQHVRDIKDLTDCLITGFEGGGNGWYVAVCQPAKYKDDRKQGPKTLWETACLFAQGWVKGYKQHTIRWDRHDQDLVNNLALHAVQQVEAGKFLGVKKDDDGEVVRDENGIPVPVPFEYWMSTISKNFTVSARERWDREKDELVGGATGDPNIEDSEHEDSEACYLNPHKPTSESLFERGADRLSAWTDERLRELPKADQEYAAFLAQGLNQKQAAVRMEESVVTARKRQQRIRIALGGMDVAAPHPDATEGTSTVVMGSTGTLAVVSL